MSRTSAPGRPQHADDDAGLSRSARARTLRLGGAARASLVLAVLLVIYAIQQPSLLTSDGQITQLVNQAAVVAIASIGETIVVLSGGFDLSVGAVVSVINVFIATHMATSTAGQLLCMVVVLALGAGIGTVHGLLVAIVRIPPIVVTLAMSFFWSGVALLILKQPGGSVPSQFVGWLTGESVPPIPNAFLLLVGLAMVWVVIRQSGLGRAIYVIGGDQNAATANGLRVRTSVVRAYALSGVFYGIAGMFLSAQSASGDPNIGAPLTLTVFTAVVVGGTIFGGGQGGAIGSIIGAFVLSVIANVLFVLGVSSFYTNVFHGAVLLLAVLATTVGAKSRGLALPFRNRSGGPRNGAGPDEESLAPETYANGRVGGPQ